MDFGSARKIKYQIRSISLPARSHPSTLKIEEELSRIDSSSPVLHRLWEIYIRLEELLHMPSTHKVLSHHNMDSILQGSMEMLDVCEILRDAVLQIKEQLQTLQSALRRKAASSEAAILEYNCFRKKIRKESIVKVVSSLKQMGNNLFLFSPPDLLTTEKDYHLIAVIRVLRRVNVFSITAFQSLSSFLSEPHTQQSTRWSSAISRMVGMESDVEVVSNEFENVDASLRCLCKLHTSKMHGTVQKQLKELETSIGDIEEALNGIFRTMIKSRTSLLNVISQ